MMGLAVSNDHVGNAFFLPSHMLTMCTPSPSSRGALERHANILRRLLHPGLWAKTTDPRIFTSDKTRVAVEDFSSDRLIV